ncbi:hypothetical protein DJ568_15340 [Mucilaginibacter hurinus]|uniref:HTH araC/xylS-type domain-containing protein n=2 Tax=Mucilaginibacter hurinus TaxID=2201324 RepID=A0A367GMJ8_9SPHI|nr:hypothetical protein DJ568_15340 [Mucilaginibacter hurinus]
MDALQKNNERTIINFADTGIDHVHLIGRYSYLGVRPQLETHIHPGMIEICYCDKGQQVYEVAGQEYHLKGGDVFVTFPNEPHSTADYPEDKGILYWLQLHVPKKGENFLGYNSAYAKTLIDAITQLPSRHFRGTAGIKKLLDDILQAGKQPMGEFNKLIVYNLVTNLLITVVKSTATPVQNKANATRILNVKQFINENLVNDLSISVLAAQQYLSESHFKSWFKREMGISPMDYVLRERVERAKRLLVGHNNTSITSIALGLNFSSSQYFATVFKKYTGLTPAGYRNMFKEGATGPA